MFQAYFHSLLQAPKGTSSWYGSFITLRFVRKSERKRTRNKSFGGFGASGCSRTLPLPDGRIVPDAVRPVATESIALELAKVVSLILTICLASLSKKGGFFSLSVTANPNPEPLRRVLHRLRAAAPPSGGGSEGQSSRWPRRQAQQLVSKNGRFVSRNDRISP